MEYIRKKMATRYSDFSPELTRKLWTIFAAVLALTVLAGLLVHPHPHFGFDGWPLFYPLFGFAACAVIIAVSNLLGKILKRPQNYYEERK